MSSPSSSLPLAPPARLRADPGRAGGPRPAGLAGRWRAPLREIAWVALALALCPIAALLTGGERATALYHAGLLVDVERALGLWVEPAVHGWLHRRPALMDAASFFYLWAHVPATGGALVWLYLNRRAAFAWARTVFVTAQTLTVTGYVLLPVAPPRFMPQLGFHDTLAETLGPGAVEGAYAFQSAYAAMPSGHVVFALVAALSLCRVASRRSVRALLLAYPMLVVAVIVGTANHFLLDAVGALVVVGLAVGAARAATAAPARSGRLAPPARAGAGPAPTPG